MKIKFGGKTYEVTRIAGQQEVTWERFVHVPKEYILDEIAIELGRMLIKEKLVEVEHLDGHDAVRYIARGLVLKEVNDDSTI